MDIEEAYRQIVTERPSAVYISGKTSTGKSTFSRRLEKECSYRLIDLDQIVMRDVVPRIKDRNEGSAFIEVYRNRDKREWIQWFITSVHAAVSVAIAAKQKVVIEGAVAHPEMLKELLRPFDDVAFIYFHPENISNYERNLTSRFLASSQENNAGLPSKFWDGIDATAFSQFCPDKIVTPILRENIHEYAIFAQRESEARLKSFQEEFEGIKVVKI